MNKPKQLIDPIDDAFDQLFSPPVSRSMVPTVRPPLEREALEQPEEIDPVISVAPDPPERAAPVRAPPGPPPRKPMLAANGLLTLAVVTSAGNARVTSGADAGSTAAQSEHFRRLAELFGAELGLERLRMMTITGATKRMISFPQDGDMVHAVVSPAFDLNALSALIRGGDK